MNVWKLLAGSLLVAALVLGSTVPITAQQPASNPAGEERAPPKRSVLRFLTDSDYPPFNYLDEENVLVGFNVDVARAICLELDVSCDVQARPWAELLANVERREADAVIASIAINPDTLQRADFTIPYNYTPARFAVRRNTPEFELTQDELEGRKVGVVTDTAHEAYVRTFFPNSEVVNFKTPSDARRALRLGQLELLFDDAANLALWMNGTESRGCCAFRGDAYHEPLFFGDGIAIAIRKGDREMQNELNIGIRRIRASGRLEEIFLQYFPIKIY